MVVSLLIFFANSKCGFPSFLLTCAKSMLKEGLNRSSSLGGERGVHSCFDVALDVFPELLENVADRKG